MNYMDSLWYAWLSITYILLISPAIYHAEGLLNIIKELFKASFGLFCLLLIAYFPVYCIFYILFTSDYGFDIFRHGFPCILGLFLASFIYFLFWSLKTYRYGETKVLLKLFKISSVLFIVSGLLFFICRPFVLEEQSLKPLDEKTYPLETKFINDCTEINALASPLKKSFAIMDPKQTWEIINLPEIELGEFTVENQRSKKAGKSMKIPDLVIGANALTGQKLRIPFEEMKRHWHVLGRTGKGKTKALEIVARHIIDTRHGLVVLDGKGDLFEAIRDYCVAARFEDRVVIVDPTEQQWAVGINYLEILGESGPEVLAERVMEGLKKCFGEEDEFKPLLEEWNPAAILPLIKAKMTLVELEEFSSIADPTFRRAVFKTIGAEGERLSKKWEELRSFGEREAAIRTAVVRTRAALIRNSPMAEAMFGQQKTTIHWRKVLDEGGIVLIRAHRHPKISQRLRTLLGVTVMHQLIETAFSTDFRKAHPRKEECHRGLLLARESHR